LPGHLPISKGEEGSRRKTFSFILLSFFSGNIVFPSATWRSYEKFYQVSIFISSNDVLCILKVFENFRRFFFVEKFPRGRKKKLFLKN
jgi:hypothetical protein